MFVFSILRGRAPRGGAGWLAAWLLAAWPGLAPACPFCSAIGNTISEEIRDADVAVVVRRKLTFHPAGVRTARADMTSTEPVRDQYEITRVMKGMERLRGLRELLLVRGVVPPVGAACLLFGFADDTGWIWSAPLEVSDAALQYLDEVQSFPPSGTSRLCRIVPYLNHTDRLIADDAYDEFARAPYAEVKGLRHDIEPLWLMHEIRRFETRPNRRRLYFTLLGVCGAAEHADFVAHQMQMVVPGAIGDEGLDAAISCYLMLRGEPGVADIERWYLRNPLADPQQLFAAISALRFHGTEEKRIRRERLAEALRNVLVRPNMADLVIADLARWEDWSVVEQLMHLFRDAGQQQTYVRVPIVNYLRVCPLPAAKAHLDRIAAEDPDILRRASLMFPLPVAAPVPPADDTGSKDSVPAITSEALSLSRGFPSSASWWRFPVTLACAVAALGWILLDPLKQGGGGWERQGHQAEVDVARRKQT